MRHPPIDAGHPGLIHGCDYNPDQWQDYPDVVADDLRLVGEARVNAWTLGVFAWSSYEPEEGRYEWGWLDRTMDAMAARGLRAVLATPSAARPAWLSQRYPEVCRVDREGRREPHRERHNHCPSSPVFRERSANIARRLAERYAGHPAVALWHIGNEVQGECHCPICLDGFRAWLRGTYGDLKTLNDAWWTAFWGHTFTDWAQIHTGIWHLHPLHLDWKRYCTTLHAACLRNEIAAVRAHSRHPVTTNLMGLSTVVDSWRLAPELDVVSLDSYPSYHETPGMADAALEVSFTHDLFRTLKGGRPYLLMEMAPSPTNTMAVPKLKRPGIHRLEALQAVAHGADSVQYFQWRKNRAGCEKFHGAVVDHAGRGDTRVFAEVAALGADLDRLRDVVGTTVEAQVAIIHDWESRWALEGAQGPKRPDKGFIETCLDHYRPFWQAGVAVDVIESTTPLDGYRLVIAPMLYLIKPGVAESLRRFVAAGGTVVATYLSGITDRHDRCLLGGWPGDGLREVFGVWAEELDCLYDADRLEVRPVGAGGPFTGAYAARHYADRLRLQGATAMAVYEGQFYAGEPAVTCHRLGAGEAWYIGSRNDRRFQADLAAHLIDRLGLRRALGATLPDGVTAQVRGDGREEFVFIMNWSGRPQSVEVGGILRDAIDGTPAGPRLDLATHGVRVLRRPATAT